MGSLLQTTLNTRALPIGNLRYIRSDYPGKLTEDEVKWLRKNDITTIVDLREEKEYKTRQCRLEKEDGFTYYHLPVTGGGDTPESPEAVARTYLGMLDGQMERIISTIMNAESNVMFFCGAGTSSLCKPVTPGQQKPPVLSGGLYRYLNISLTFLKKEGFVLKFLSVTDSSNSLRSFFCFSFRFFGISTLMIRT